MIIAAWCFSKGRNLLMRLERVTIGYPPCRSISVLGWILVPDKECSNFLEKGVLEIYRTGKEDKPLVGRYDTVPVEDEDGDTYALWQFTYNGEQRLFTRTVTGNEGSSVIKCVLAENVTPFCSSGLLPEGVLVIYREQFTVRME